MPGTVLLGAWNLQKTKPTKFLPSWSSYSKGKKKAINNVTKIYCKLNGLSDMEKKRVWGKRA